MDDDLGFRGTSLEQAIITKTIVRGSSELVPVRKLNGSFAHGRYVIFCHVEGFASIFGEEEYLSFRRDIRTFMEASEVCIPYLGTLGSVGVIFLLRVARLPDPVSWLGVTSITDFASEVMPVSFVGVSRLYDPASHVGNVHAREVRNCREHCCCRKLDSCRE